MATGSSFRSRSLLKNWGGSNLQQGNGSNLGGGKTSSRVMGTQSRINRPLVRTFSSRLVSSRLVPRPSRHGRWATDIEASIIQDKAVRDRQVTVTRGPTSPPHAKKKRKSHQPKLSCPQITHTKKIKIKPMVIGCCSVFVYIHIHMYDCDYEPRQANAVLR